jgi:diamine N-acetyltransferase
MSGSAFLRPKLEALFLRAATLADVEDLMACERQPGYEETVGRWSREEHLAGLVDASHRYFVAQDQDGAISGFVMLQEVGSPTGAVLVRRIAVMEQGCGFGRRLLEHALATIFSELGASKAWLKVWPHNRRGLALYASLGMREEGRTVPRDETRGPMLIMAIDAEAYRKRRSSSP